MLSYSEAELRGKTLEQLTHPDDWDASLTVRHQLLAGEISSHTAEKRYIRKDGTIYWEAPFYHWCRIVTRWMKYFIAVVEDITDKIEAETRASD